MDQSTGLPLYEYVMRQLEATTLTYQQIADGSGVSKRTIEKIKRREIADPGVSHIQNLADYFRGIKREPPEPKAEQAAA